MSMSNTRFNNCAQHMPPFPAGVWSQSPAFAGAVATGGGCGCGGKDTTAFRSFSFGASTP